MPKTLDAFIEDKNTKLIRKRDLKRSSNLKKEFNEINQHLYAKLKHTETDTRARSKEILKLILCKLVDEISNSLPDSIMSFSIGQDETEKNLFERLQKFFKENLKDNYKNLIDENERINLNKELVFLIVEKLQRISLLESSKDILADTFEIFVSRLIKEEGGQFFTPASIIKFMVRYLNPETDSKIVDPACGHGGFLLECKDLLWSKIEQKYGAQSDIFKKKKPPKLYPIFMEFNKESAKRSTNMVLSGILPNGIDLFSKLKLRLFSNSSNADFFTSDHPVCRYNHYMLNFLG